MVTFIDITERKERDQQLIHAQKMEVLGQLTGGIAHDFNNLLTIILGNLRFLREDTAIAANGALQELVEDASSAARDGAELTRRLLAFSRKQTLCAEIIDINAFLADTSGFLRRLIGEGFNLELRSGEEALTVRADAQQLHSAILNLTINAADAMSAGDVVVIEASRAELVKGSVEEDLESGPYVVLSVKDTGSGMDEEVARRAVEPFFTTKQPGSGSGLGLSMVYGFAKQSGGGLRIRSTPGEGTHVSLFLPLADAVPGEVAEASAQRRICADGEKILVVEDEPRLRKFACRSLAAAGYQVRDAGDAATACRILTTESDIDLLFSDIVMPGDMNGRELARWAREHRPLLKVLLTTGFSVDMGGGATGTEDFALLEKPYTKDHLYAAIRDIFGTAAQGH
jgi:nitrogen-specific signal transduction histidine kinase/ActR/RegA family two-component response regulator